MALAAGLLTAAAPARQAENEVVVLAVRLYKAELKQTRVKAFLQIPYALCETGSDGRMSYRVAVKVSDSTGLVLNEDTWRGHPRGELRQPGAFAVEMIEFAVAPGRYQLDVAVEDSVSGRRASATRDVEGFLDQPAASDLVLAPQIRLATPSDTAPRAGEWRHANALVTATARLMLTPLRSKAYYLLEAYSEHPDSGTMSVAIADRDGKSVLHTEPRPLKVGAGGGVIKGEANLAGLPAGDYTFTVTLSLGSRTVERSATLNMAGLQETMARASEQREIERITDAGYFAALTEGEMDEAEAPLIYLAKSGELAVYGSGLSPAAKSKFLVDFWTRWDTTPGPWNQAREAFYAGVAYANKAFKESAAATTPGWRTDRGRIYAKYGAAEEIWRRPREGQAPDIEVWRYTREKNRYFIFADRTGLGGFRLIHSNEFREASMPGWMEIIGRYAVEDIGRFVGVDLLAERPGY